MRRIRLYNKDVILVGDIHGRFGEFIDKLRSEKIKDTDIIVLGDVGFFNEYDVGRLMYENDLAQYIDINGCTIYFMRGNHDNPEIFRNPNITTFFNKCECIGDNCIFKSKFGNILAIGGSFSIDRYHRTKDLDYFDEELPIFEFGFRDKIDMMLTHYIPSDRCGIPKKLFMNSNMFSLFNKTDEQVRENKHYRKWDYIEEYLNINFNFLINSLCPSKYYFGHYHKHLEFTEGTTDYQALNVLEFIKL